MNVQEEVRLGEQVLTEFAQFIVSLPTLQQIADYKVSEAVQAHVRLLLDANRDNTLGKEGQEDLDDYLNTSHFMTMIKIYANAKIDGIDLSASP